MEKDIVKNENQNPIVNICSNSQCGKPAKLRCPNCKKYGIKEGSYFCEKDCFNNFWTEHKKIHIDCIFLI